MPMPRHRAAPESLHVYHAVLLAHLPATTTTTPAPPSPHCATALSFIYLAVRLYRCCHPLAHLPSCSPTRLPARMSVCQLVHWLARMLLPHCPHSFPCHTTYALATMPHHTHMSHHIMSEPHEPSHHAGAHMQRHRCHVTPGAHMHAQVQREAWKREVQQCQSTYYKAKYRGLRSVKL
jgi:hypothetical protein